MEINKEYKLILLGESNVGKTCIINQFINGKFEKDFLTTLSAQY